MLRLIKKYIKKLLTEGQFIQGAINGNDRRSALHRSWGHVYANHINGCYVEFGVYKGDSLIESYRQYSIFNKWLIGQLNSNEIWRRRVASKFENFEPHFYGLDTFTGIPNNNEGEVIFSEGTYHADFNEVNEKLERVRVPKVHAN